MSLLASLYRLLTDLGAPVINAYLKRRLRKGREDAERFTERLGQPSKPRPKGALIWCHGASVGEANAILILIERLRQMVPHINILLTTGTVSSARLMEARLPPSVIHQYLPVDRMAYVQNFLNHWQPDLVLWTESEIWPNMLASLHARLIPAVLLNGRMSDKSFRHWQRWKGWTRTLLGPFRLALTQSEDERVRFMALGIKNAHCIGNMKYAAKPLPYTESALLRLQQAIGDRPVWLMASTHRGEEEIALSTHTTLRQNFPDILTIIAPRHVMRGHEIAMLCQKQNNRCASRSKDESITPETEIYLADTMGELGLFYHLSPVMAMGGSFVPHGGHNPIEPAQLGCGIILGPEMFNFSAITSEFKQHEAALQLNGGNELSYTVERLLRNPAELTRMTQNAHILADEKQHVIDRIIDLLRPILADLDTSKTQRRAS